MPSPSPILAPSDLLPIAHAVTLFDVRSGKTAGAAYAEGHLPFAIHADLDTQLAAQLDPAVGGRHPLPPIAVFAKQLGEWGVTPDTQVVLYDDQGGMNAAARMWWMLRAVGHDRVQVLDGGLSAALASGFALTNEHVKPKSAPAYPTTGYGLPTCEIDEVDGARTSSSRRVLDVRAAVRYRGENETIDPIAGHIPGALNIPLTENLHASGRFKSNAELRVLYASFLGKVQPQDLIVHCGSGVTACHTLLALELAGLPGAKLYVGSWSEWCRSTRPRDPSGT